MHFTEKYIYILRYDFRTGGTLDTYINNVHYISGICNVTQTYPIINSVELPTAKKNCKTFLTWAHALIILNIFITILKKVN